MGIGKDCQLAYDADKDGRVIMPTRNINLTAEQDAFVEEIVRAGKYQNASEAMRDAIRGLQQRLKADELKLDLLRTQVKAGLDALARGAFIEVDDADLDATLDDLVTDSGP
jgi:antitoxin ParD1/3/4